MLGARARPVVVAVGFTLLLVAAVAVGRATRTAPGQLALVWPAAGVGVWWLLCTRGVRSRTVAVLLLTVATVLTNLATGAPAVVALLFGAINAMHAVVGLLLLERLLHGARRLRTPDDVISVLVAATGAAAVSASASAAVASLLLDEDLLQTLLLVGVRNGGSTFVLVSTVLALGGAGLPDLLRGRRRGLLWATPAAAGVAAVVLSQEAPLLFLVVLVPVWFGVRLGLGATAVAGLLLSIASVAATLAGHGPLAAVADEPTRAVAVQAFIVVLTLVGLSLATLQRAHETLTLRLDLSRRELQHAADAAVIGKAVVLRGADGGWTLTHPNPALVRLLRRDPTAMRWRELLPPEDSLVVRAAIDRIAEGLDASWEGEVRHCLPGGGVVWTQLHVSRMATEDGSTSVVAEVLDITERRAAHKELSHLAMHDVLTGLPNRARLHDALADLLVTAGTTSAPAAHRVAVVFLDLDGFKPVNDRYGHDVGDAVLQAVAGALTSALRPGDTVGRLGGDEFVVCCPGVAGPAEAEAVVRRLVATLQPALLVRGRDVGLGVSAGWALSEPGDGVLALLKRADEAMYTVKRGHKRVGDLPRARDGHAVDRADERAR